MPLTVNEGVRRYFRLGMSEGLARGKTASPDGLKGSAAVAGLNQLRAHGSLVHHP